MAKAAGFGEDYMVGSGTVTRLLAEPDRDG